MTKDFDLVLDECIDRMNRGESLDSCLADYPEFAAKLEPVLYTMAQTKAAYDFVPSADVKRAARQRFFAALDKQRKPSFWQRKAAQRALWTSVATAVVIVFIGYAALRATLVPELPAPSVFPAATPTVTIKTVSNEGNFAFLVSDEINDIADFSKLDVTIEKVSLLKSSPNKWIEFVPETKQFDLTLLPGDKTQQLWQGDVPEGEYSKVIVDIGDVRGTLKSTQETLDIKLPSSKLTLDSPFNVSTDNITSFTYDLTVIKTGTAPTASAQNKYLLKPQAGESGASQKPNPNPSHGKGKGQGQDKDKEKPVNVPRKK